MTGSATLKLALARVSADIDHGFDRLLPIPPDARARLYEAMRYSAIGGGKRIRPLLVVAGCDLFNVARDRALRVALAVECIHPWPSK
jgi:farnesyl diphosphate synthase